VQLRSGEDRFFTGRTAELAWLDTRARSAIGPAVHIVVGGAGVGKSALAEHYARRVTDRYRLVWWIGAADVEQVEKGLADLAVRLEPMLAAAPLEVSRMWALGWLESHGDWLVVLDDVSSPQVVAAFLDVSDHGRLLVTSRELAGWERLAAPLTLDVLPEQAAVALMTSITSEAVTINPGDAAALCAKLGFLPSAIVAAATHMARTQTSPGTYLESMRLFPGASWPDAAGFQSVVEVATAVKSFHAAGSPDYAALASTAKGVLLAETLGRLTNRAGLPDRSGYATLALKAFGLSDQQVAGWKGTWDKVNAAQPRSGRSPGRPDPARLSHTTRRRRRGPLTVINSGLSMLIAYLGLMCVAFAGGAAVAERSAVQHVGFWDWIALAVSVAVIVACMRYVWNTTLSGLGGTTTSVSLVAALAAGWLLTRHSHAFHFGPIRGTTAHIGSTMCAWLIWRF
jgi:hypothetical protein